MGSVWHCCARGVPAGRALRSRHARARMGRAQRNPRHGYGSAKSRSLVAARRRAARDTACGRALRAELRAAERAAAVAANATPAPRLCSCGGECAVFRKRGKLTRRTWCPVCMRLRNNAWRRGKVARLRSAAAAAAVEPGAFHAPLSNRRQLRVCRVGGASAPPEPGDCPATRRRQGNPARRVAVRYRRTQRRCPSARRASRPGGAGV